ncbi:MAG: response regulator [Candidatus Latescibacteria bacterium]|nr:response regulator [Candidatus Latescibacterota bacterium]NIO56209.1 response regulator [Candidatus Latescibacterota bacterium]
MFTIMVVEDNAVFRQLLTETLRSQFSSIRVLEAETAMEALQKVRTTSPDLIFMDIRLPGETGLELTKKIKSQHPSTIIVILTGHDLPEYREAAKKYKADHFLFKGSLTAAEISKLVKDVLTDRKIELGREKPK